MPLTPEDNLHTENFEECDTLDQPKGEHSEESLDGERGSTVAGFLHPNLKWPPSPGDVETTMRLGFRPQFNILHVEQTESRQRQRNVTPLRGLRVRFCECRPEVAEARRRRGDERHPPADVEPKESASLGCVYVNV